MAAILLAILATQARADVSGEYEMVGSDHCSGSMQVVQSLDDLLVSVATVCGPSAHDCDFTGQGKTPRNGGEATVVEPEGCRLFLRFAEGSAKIRQGESCSCGLNAFMTGDYEKRTAVEAFAGRIGDGIPIRMKFFARFGDEIEGLYFYEKYRANIRVRGRTDGEGRLAIQEFDERGNCTGAFEGRYVSRDRIEGFWSKPDGSASKPFVLQRTTD